MKVENLMIGDWIMYKSDSPKNAFPIKVTAEMFTVDLVRWYDRFEYIPLTSEILLKNGFEKHTSNTRMFFNCGEYCLSYYPVGKHFTIYNQIDGSLVQKVIVNVHELQHALKLCEIDKNIEL